MNAVTIGQDSEVVERLRSLKLKIHSAAEGIEGIRKVIRFRPDLMFVDVDLPMLDGINLVKIANLLGMDIPVVFTAHSEKYKKRATLFKNFVDYLEYPDVASALTEDLMVKIDKVRRNMEQAPTHLPCDMTRDEQANLLAKPGRKRLLIVEDDAVTLKMTVGTLTNPDEYEIFTAKDGLEGLFKAVLTNPDLILSDITMPKLDGLTMCQILYILGKPYPVVFLTGRNDEEFVAKARNLSGVIGYMVKGGVWEIGRISGEIEKHLRMAATLRESSEAQYQEGSLAHLEKTGGMEGMAALE